MSTKKKALASGGEQPDSMPVQAPGSRLKAGERLAYGCRRHGLQHRLWDDQYAAHPVLYRLCRDLGSDCRPGHANFTYF